MIGHTKSAQPAADQPFKEAGGAVSYSTASRAELGRVGERTPYVNGGFGQSLSTVAERRSSFSDLPVDTVDSAISGMTHTRSPGLVSSCRRLPQHRSTRTSRRSSLGGDRESSTSSPRSCRVQTLLHRVRSAQRWFTIRPERPDRAGARARYRFELSQTAARCSIERARRLRKYVSLCGRSRWRCGGMHYGRYGRDARSRLGPSISAAGLVRGYEITSFDASACGAATDGTCAASTRPRQPSRHRQPRTARTVVGLFKPSAMYGGSRSTGLFADAEWLTKGLAPAFSAARATVKSVGAALRFTFRLRDWRD